MSPQVAADIIHLVNEFSPEVRPPAKREPEAAAVERDGEPA